MNPSLVLRITHPRTCVADEIILTNGKSQWCFRALGFHKMDSLSLAGTVGHP